ncbi:MAG TPA: CBS domain-containing protein [Acidimicrobiales bacterium]|nr:CBS domain-containing protein [Acidimicrobiales bacterium]
MPADTPVRDVMTTDVVAFGVDDDIRTAMQTLVDRGIDGGPVLDADGQVVGVLTTGDLIVRQSKLHFPSVIVFLGTSLSFKRRDFDDDLEKVLGSSVREVMNEPPIVCRPETTLEEAATLMHEHRISRLPVVDPDGHLAGIVSRVDLLRGALASS